MKKILLLASAVALPFMATSCADFGTYGFGTVGGFGNPGFVGGGLAPLQVGFVATSFDQWAYDPFCRHYFDRRVGRYWDPRIRGYCAAPPRRFSSPIYPTGFRHGRPLACPTFLPRHTGVVRHGGNYRQPVGVSNRGRYAPVVHGRSRGSTSIRTVGNYTRNSNGAFTSRSNYYRPSTYSTAGRTRSTTSRSSYYRPSTYSTPSRTRSTTSRSSYYRPSTTYSTPSRSRSTTTRSSSYRPSTYSTPSRSRSTTTRSSNYRPSTYSTPSRSRSSTTRSSNYRPTSSSGRYQTITSSPSRSRSTPTVRSSSYTPRSSPSRSSYSRSTPSRSTSSPSRSIGQARQRTR